MYVWEKRTLLHVGATYNNQVFMSTQFEVFLTTKIVLQAHMASKMTMIIPRHLALYNQNCDQQRLF